MSPSSSGPPTRPRPRPTLPPPLARSTIAAGLELIDSSSTGVVINRPRRAGEIRYGTFAVDEPGGVEALWTEGGEL